MAKRGAGSELNHDNWDEEEEQEEAGEFKKASEEQMKGRVIKKAKRKLTEDGRKNVFSGFGGFTSSNKSASEAFSFLGQAAKIEEKEPKDLKGEESKNDLMAKFKPISGNWSCEVCMISNSSDKTKCVACESPKPGAKATSELSEPKPKSFSFGIDGGFKFNSTPVSGVSSAAGGSAGDKSLPVGGGFNLGFFSSENKEQGGGSSNGGGEFKTEEDPASEPSKSSFSFGEGGGFKFAGVSSAENTAVSGFKLVQKTKEADLGGFKFGGNFDSTENSNKGTEVKTGLIENVEPVSTFGEVGGFKFSSTDSTKSVTDSDFKYVTASEDKKESPPGGFKFGGAPSSGKDEDSDPKPGETDLMAKFKPSSGNWSCEVCMISNKPDKVKCAACETPKPGLTKSLSEPEEAKQSSFSFGEGGGFKFTATESSSSTPASGFKFGEEPDKTTENSVVESKNSNIFNNSAETCIPTGFSFSHAVKNTSGEFPYEQKDSSECVKSKKEDFFEKNVATPIPIGFKFGEIKAGEAFKNASGCFEFEHNKTSESSGAETPKSGKKREYLSCLKALNIQVTNWIKSHVDENPLVDLTPVFKDYKNHIDELKNKYKDESGKSPHENTTLNKSIDLGAKEKEEEVEKPFSFGFSKTGSGSLSFPLSSGQTSLKFGAFNKDDKVGESKTEIADKDVKTVLDEDPVDETDSLYSKKCKLFYKKGEAYVERGLGHIHLKQTEDGRLQVVVRADTSLGNILLNIVMSSKVPLQRQGKNNLLLVCVPNPPLDPKGELEPIPFLIRVKTAEDADELKQKMIELMKSDTE